MTIVVVVVMMLMRVILGRVPLLPRKRGCYLPTMPTLNIVTVTVVSHHQISISGAPVHVIFVLCTSYQERTSTAALGSVSLCLSLLFVALSESLHAKLVSRRVPGTVTPADIDRRAAMPGRRVSLRFCCWNVSSPRSAILVERLVHGFYPSP